MVRLLVATQRLEEVRPQLEEHRPEVHPRRSQAHKLVAFIPYLGKDFGIKQWLHLQKTEVKDRAVIKLRGREQERRVAARTTAGRASLTRVEGEDTLIRRLTITSSYGPKELMKWYKRVPCGIEVRETWV